MLSKLRINLMPVEIYIKQEVNIAKVTVKLHLVLIT